MKILFVYPSWTGDYGLIAHFARRAGVFPPLNLALLAAICERNGHECQIIDGEALALSMEKLVIRSIEANPDMIAVTGMSPFFHKTVEFAEKVKRIKNIKIIAGGQHITIVKSEGFHKSFDFGIVGEAEETLPAFLNLYENGKDYSKLQGLLYRDKNDEIHENGTSEPFNDTLDNLPLPSRHLLPMNKYRMGTLHGRLPFSSIQTIRGCPWKCIFCASDQLNTTKIRMRSPKSTADELEHVVNTYNIKHFMFVDDVLTLYKDHIIGICDEIINRNLKITFEGSTRANLINEEITEKLKNAGLIRLSFGLESADEAIRKTMNKKVPLKYYTRANKILDENGIECLNSVMLGLPGETRKTIYSTLDFLQNDKHIKQANFAIAVPYPGTKFHDFAINEEHGMKIIDKDFSKYRRYGNAVTDVGDLSAQDLIDLQNEGFVRIYSAPWRWKPMFAKHGIIGGLLTLMRVFKLIIKKHILTQTPFRIHPGVP